MNLFRPLVAFALFFPFFAAQAGSNSSWQELEVEDLSEAWKNIFSTMRKNPWVQADFSETRVYPFRRQGVELSGTLWFGRAEGLTLHYKSPREEIIRIDETGLRVLRDEYDVRTSRIEEDQDIPNTLLALFRFDLAELEQVFELSGRLDDDRWELRLTPRKAGAPIEQIELAGDEVALSEIRIQQSRSRRIEIQLENIQFPAELDDAERAKQFP